MMRIKCYRCGKSISTDIPDDTVFRAVAECPECLEDMGDVRNELAEIEGERDRLREEIADLNRKNMKMAQAGLDLITSSCSLQSSLFQERNRLRELLKDAYASLTLFCDGRAWELVNKIDEELRKS